MRVKVGLTVYEGRPVRHADGSRGVLLDEINGTPAGPDTTGAWSVPVYWYEGPAASRWPRFSLAELVSPDGDDEALRETLDILADPDLMRALAEAEREEN